MENGLDRKSSKSGLGSAWRFQEHDRDILREELEHFLPDRIFDAHAHLYDKSHFSELPSSLNGAPERIGLQDYREQMEQLLPGREVAAILIPFPLSCCSDAERVNRFVAAEARLDPASRSEFLVKPEMDPEFVRQNVRQLGCSGLKCYHIFSRSEPTWNAVIGDFLPELIVSVAHQEKLFITLHIVRDNALADPLNQELVRRYCRSYPDMQLILAHAARGFNFHHTEKGIGPLMGLDNVWFDSSAITESGALEAIIRTLGHERLMWGSDFPVSHMRGRCVGIGNGFVWLDDEMLKGMGGARSHLKPTLVGIESLRALKQAAINLRLSDPQIEDIFWGNAQRLLSRTSCQPSA